MWHGGGRSPSSSLCSSYQNQAPMVPLCNFSCANRRCGLGPLCPPSWWRWTACAHTFLESPLKGRCLFSPDFLGFGAALGHQLLGRAVAGLQPWGTRCQDSRWPAGGHSHTTPTEWSELSLKEYSQFYRMEKHPHHKQSLVHRHPLPSTAYNFISHTGWTVLNRKIKRAHGYHGYTKEWI